MKVSTLKTEGKLMCSFKRMMQFSFPYLEWIPPSTQKILLYTMIPYFPKFRKGFQI